MSTNIQIPVTTANANPAVVSDHFHVQSIGQLLASLQGDGFFPFKGVIVIDGTPHNAKDLNGQVCVGTGLHVKIRDYFALIDGTVVAVPPAYIMYTQKNFTTVNVAAAVGHTMYIVLTPSTENDNNGNNVICNDAGVFTLQATPAAIDSGMITVAKITIPGATTQITAAMIDNSVKDYLDNVDDLAAEIAAGSPAITSIQNAVTALQALTQPLITGPVMSVDPIGVAQLDSGNSSYAVDVNGNFTLPITALGGTAENFTTYTKVDPANIVTVNSTTMSVAGLTNQGEYVCKDFGSGTPLTGDFVHNFTFTMSSVQDGAWTIIYALSNVLGTAAQVYADSTGPQLFYIYGSGNQFYFIAYNGQGSDTSDLMPAGTYYLTLSRVGGYIGFQVFSDAARTNLIFTTPWALISTTFRYRYALCSAAPTDNFAPFGAVSFSISNLILSGQSTTYASTGKLQTLKLASPAAIGSAVTMAASLVTPANTTLTLDVTLNGGTNWATNVGFGNIVNGLITPWLAVGSDLRIRINLATTVATSTPTIKGVTVSSTGATSAVDYANIRTVVNELVTAVNAGLTQTIAPLP